MNPTEQARRDAQVLCETVPPTVLISQARLGDRVVVPSGAVQHVKRVQLSGGVLYVDTLEGGSFTAIV